MKSLTVGELKARFSDVLREVQEGESVAVEFGRRRRKIAVIVPYAPYAQEETRKSRARETPASHGGVGWGEGKDAAQETDGAEVTVSAKGEIMLPAGLRKRLGMTPGTTLALRDQGGRLVAVRKTKPDPFRKWRGSGRLPRNLSVDQYLSEVRG